MNLLVREPVLNRGRKSISLKRLRVECAGVNKGKVNAKRTTDPGAIDGDENTDSR
jgi:hypothetical protein